MAEFLIYDPATRSGAALERQLDSALAALGMGPGLARWGSGRLRIPDQIVAQLQRAPVSGGDYELRVGSDPDSDSLPALTHVFLEHTRRHRHPEVWSSRLIRDDGSRPSPEMQDAVDRLWNATNRWWNCEMPRLEQDRGTEATNLLGVNQQYAIIGSRYCTVRLVARTQYADNFWPGMTGESYRGVEATVQLPMPQPGQSMAEIWLSEPRYVKLSALATTDEDPFLTVSQVEYLAGCLLHGEQIASALNDVALAQPRH